MRPGPVVVAVVAIVLAAMCARMGIWQLSRWSEKRHLADAYRAALAAPPVPLPASPGAWGGVGARRVIARGTYDARWQVTLCDRWRGDSAAVELLTPMRLRGGALVLVDRGGLPSTDGIHARLQDYGESGEVQITGLLERLPEHAKGAAWERLPDEAAVVWSVRALGLDSLTAHAPMTFAPWLLRALPDPSAPPLPERLTPEPPQSLGHLSYAVQWFLFAAAFLAGWLFVLRRERGAKGA